MARKTLKEQKAAKALKTAEQTALKNETAAAATAEAAASSIKETKTTETVKEEVKKVETKKVEPKKVEAKPAPKAISTQKDTTKGIETKAAVLVDAPAKEEKAPAKRNICKRKHPKAKKAENQLQYGSYTIQNRIFRVYFGYFGTLLFMTCVV